MFGITFRRGGDSEDSVGLIAIIRFDRSDVGLAVSEDAGFVEQDGIDLANGSR